MQKTFSLMFKQGSSYWLIAIFSFAMNCGILLGGALWIKNIIDRAPNKQTVTTENSISITADLTSPQVKELIGCIILLFFILAFFANINRIATQRFTRDILTGKKGKFFHEWLYSFRFTLSLVFWLIIQSTIGLLLSILRGSSEPKTPIGYILNSVRSFLAGGLALAWNTATFFVIPFIGLESTGAWTALKKSMALMKESFGESITATFSFGWINSLIAFSCFGLGYILPNGYQLIAIPIAIYLFTMTWLAQEVFRTILYLFLTGQKDIILGQEFAEISFEKKN